MTNATNTTDINLDFPDATSEDVTFTLIDGFINSGGIEIVAGESYTTTLDGSGTGTETLPTPDATGTAGATWGVSIPSKGYYEVVISWSAGAQNLSDILAAQTTTTDPDTITASLANKQDRDTSATVDNLAKFDADGNTVDAGVVPADFVAVVGDTMTGNLTMGDNRVIRPLLVDAAELANNIGGGGGGTVDIDLESGNFASVTVDTAETTFTFSNPPANGRVGSLTLEVTNGGSQTVTWPGAVKWASGNAPTLTASGVDILTFYTRDGGTTWYGFAAGLDMQ